MDINLGGILLNPLYDQTEPSYSPEQAGTSPASVHAEIMGRFPHDSLLQRRYIRKWDLFPLIYVLREK